jgi:hypothetical protein
MIFSLHSKDEPHSVIKYRLLIFFYGRHYVLYRHIYIDRDQIIAKKKCQSKLDTYVQHELSVYIHTHTQ